MTGIQKATLLVMGLAACQPAVTAAPAPAPAALEDVLSIPGMAGETVQVAGRCLDSGAEPAARSAKPHSGSFWLLEKDGVAAWVEGPRPAACGSDTEVAFTALVAQDTLPKLSPARTIRNYLVAR